ncbi:Chondramide synthase cmdD [Posidoniimonas polymericola]|uniref:Chondramide synthase cmdD n=1 Tax=Posidoniimonas polymericola TaxID=2528002 RepID=A0A5C5YQM7_9BACT|nr:non-ribosomal peptide synthetase [Posidoniimonas polymericola]TWT77108.1 Chondramide synthase cmdD [Posidoniimonas polymericola]
MANGGATEGLRSLSPTKRAALEKLLLKRRDAAAEAARIPLAPPDRAAELSFAERRLWLLDKLEPNHPFYNMPLAARVTGPLDRGAFAASLAALCAQHETLRYSYHLRDGRPERSVAERVAIAPEYIDARSLAGDRAALDARLREEARVPFDLARPPLLRCVMLELSDAEQIVLLVMHHIVSDGWSMWVMLNELATGYEVARAGSEPAAPLPIQYSDYAVWQRTSLDDSRRATLVSYWKSKLADAPPLLELPADHARGAVQDFDGAVLPFRLSDTSSAALQATADRHQATPFMVLMAAYQAWLARMTGQQDLLVGTVVAGRSRSELERLIGFFVNTLAVRGDLSGEPSFDQLVERVRAESLDAFAHQDLPFDQLIEAVAPERDQSHAALFQTALVVQNPPRDFAAGEGLSVEPLLVDNGTAKYDLTLFFWRDDEGWAGQIEYRTSLFEPATIERFAAGFQTLLSDALARPTAAIDELELLADSERRLLASFNETHTPLVGPLIAHELFQQSAADARPEATAILDGGNEVTWRALAERVNHAAAGLQSLGVQRGDAVIVALDRSFDSVTAMLAAMTAGAVYVPVDPHAGPQRIRFVTDDTRAKLILGEVSDPPIDSQSVTGLVELGVGKDFAAPEVSPDDLAYIIYTSGSTGVPKGVQVQHRSIVNFVRAQARLLGVTAGDRVLHVMSPSFDGGLSESFLPLATGATMIVASRQQVLDPTALTRLLQESSATIAKFPPALLATLDPDSFPALKTISTGGDTLTTELARRWLPGRRMLNGYGPTEATVGVSMHVLREPLTGLPPIGPPMANMRAYVLDKNLRQVPIGVAGEICIGGAGVAVGYLNQPEQTAAKFVRDPIADDGSRMYRTGDVGRWRADGELEFLGRLDDQVQLRGYRVEPSEVAAALERLPQVDQAFVTVKPDARGEDRLVAYVTPAKAGLAADQGEANHVAAWRSLMEGSHRAAGALRDTEFDTTGWISTYTGLPIPKDQMRAWAEAAANQILGHKPRRVLEIGCGTGLILLRVAPSCESYHGVDFLERSLNQLARVVDDRGLADKVTLGQMTADQVGQLSGHTFDTIVCNSVAQYFPSGDYLRGVIRDAAELVAPGGRMFLGDFRNLRLHEALAASVEIARADARLSRRELLGRIEAQLRREEELLIDPDLFERLGDDLPRLSGVQIQLKPGDADNELTRFRYDVTLSFDEPPESVDPVRCQADLAAVAKALSKQPAAVVVESAINPRVAADARVWGRLRDESETQTTAELKQARHEHPSEPTPDQWRALGAEHGYQTEVRWGAEPDTIEVRYTLPGKAVPPPNADSLCPLSRCTNEPMQQKLLARLAPELRAGLAESLPQYMLPSAFVVLDAFPQTSNGKIDRDALPPPPSGRPAWATGYTEPRDDEERLIAEVWEQLLGVSPVGAEDDFFELGGHSMLAVQVMSEIEARAGRALPLAALFQDPTVENLARLLREPAEAAAAMTLIPLQKEGAAAPLFCVHPAGGAVFCYQELAAHFAGERPVIGVQAHGVDGLRPPHEDMPSMAAAYAEAIQALRPHGPYHICGWSIGGNIAYEVARRLREGGGEVGLVALFDAGAIPPEGSLGEEDLLPLLEALFPESDHAPLAEIRGLSPEDQVAFFTERAAKAGLVDPAQLAASQHIFSVFQNNVTAVHKHQAESYPGPVTLFRAGEQTKTNQLFDDPQLGWGPLTELVRVLEVPSDHTQMMVAPQVDALAALVKAELERVEAS